MLSTKSVFLIMETNLNQKKKNHIMQSCKVRVEFCFFSVLQFFVENKKRYYMNSTLSQK